MLKKIWLSLALLWTGIILYLCLIRASSLPSIDVTNLDKFVHAFFHFVFIILWFLALHFSFRSQSHVKLLGIVFFTSLLFGITIELFQAFFTATRNGDFVDVLSNTTGALLAVFLLTILDKRGFLNRNPE